jgi:hypothetical protein
MRETLSCVVSIIKPYSFRLTSIVVGRYIGFMDAKLKADQMLEETAMIYYGVPYAQLSDMKQSICISLALDNFSDRELDMADYARKRERENGR